MLFGEVTMYTFTILLLPFVATLFMFCDKKSLCTFMLGVFSGTFLSFGYAVLAFRHREVEFSAFQNFLYYFVVEYSLPLLVFYFLYKASSHRAAHDEPRFYTTYRLSFMLGVFAIYAPYCIISTSKIFSAFELFLKPGLYFAMLVIFCAKVHQSFRLRTPLAIVVTILSLVIPPMINMVWLLRGLDLYVRLASGVFIVYALILFVKKFLLVEQLDTSDTYGAK